MTFLKDIKQLFDKDNIQALITAFAIFMSFSPFFTWQFPISIGGIAVLTVFIVNIRNLRFQTNIWFVLFSLLYVVLAFRGNYSFAGFVLLILLCTIFYIDERRLQRIYISFLFLFSILCSISFLIYLCAVIIELPIPSHQIDPLYETKTEGGISYYSYPFLVVSESALSLLRYRFCAYFDEPGVIGTIAGSCLLINRYDFKKWYNVGLFIFGLFSLSLYFFFITFVFFLVFANKKVKFLLLIFFCILLFFLWDNDIVSTMLLDRLSFEEGIGSINNREHMSDAWWNNFVHSDSFLWGMGGGTALIVNEGGSSYKEIIIDHGVIFFISYVMIYCFMAKSKIINFMQTLRCFMVFASVLFQRPYIDAFGYVFLIFIPIIIIANQSKNYEINSGYSPCNIQR